MAALAAYFCGLFLTYRHRFYLATARDQGFRIRSIRLDEFDDRFRLTDSGPTTDAQVIFIGGGDEVPAGTTLTLPPDAHDQYAHDEGDSTLTRDIALEESYTRTFLYAGTAVESKCTQLYGDSKNLDVEPYRGRCDLIFVDGAHAYSYVTSDSRKAFEMLSPTGTIVWHDYKKRSGVPREVMRALDDIARTRPLRRLAGTHMVAYRRIWETEAGSSTT
jgi:hypothetical protein